MEDSGVFHEKIQEKQQLRSGQRWSGGGTEEVSTPERIQKQKSRERYNFVTG